MNNTSIVVRGLFPRHASVSCWVKIASLIVAIAAGSGKVYGAAFTDPGFESYAVSSGGYVQPTSGPWTFSNDAGVVEPYSANSSTGPLNTWSAVPSAMDGQQYASTYAGSDTIRQVVSFSVPGSYMISVYAAAPDGSVTIPSVGTLQLVDGEFTFALGGSAIGNVNTVPKGSSWTSYSAMFAIGKPGDYVLGVQNTKSAPYFINYDAFAIQSVPEPTTFHLLLILGVLAAGARAARRWWR
jgi:hypothetical protein